MLHLQTAFNESYKTIAYKAEMAGETAQRTEWMMIPPVPPVMVHVDLLKRLEALGSKTPLADLVATVQDDLRLMQARQGSYTLWHETDTEPFSYTLEFLGDVILAKPTTYLYAKKLPEQESQTSTRQSGSGSCNACNGSCTVTGNRETANSDCSL